MPQYSSMSSWNAFSMVLKTPPEVEIIVRELVLVWGLHCCLRAMYLAHRREQL